MYLSTLVWIFCVFYIYRYNRILRNRTWQFLSKGMSKANNCIFYYLRPYFTSILSAIKFFSIALIQVYIQLIIAVYFLDKSICCFGCSSITRSIVIIRARNFIHYVCNTIYAFYVLDRNIPANTYHLCIFKHRMLGGWVNNDVIKR